MSQIWTFPNYGCNTTCISYSKTCVKQPFSKRPKIGFQDQLSLNAGQKYCRKLQGEHYAIFSTFIKLPFVIKIFVLSIFEWFYCILNSACQSWLLSSAPLVCFCSQKYYGPLSEIRVNFVHKDLLVLILYLLVSSADLYKKHEPRSGPTYCQAWSGFKLCDTLLILLKGSYENVNFEKQEMSQTRDECPQRNWSSIRHIWGKIAVI